jgi:hypothetical protein
VLSGKVALLSVSDFILGLGTKAPIVKVKMLNQIWNAGEVVGVIIIITTETINASVSAAK